MPRESRASIKRPESGATYYVRSRTIEQTPLFTDEATKEWVYDHILWMGSVHYVTFRAISVTDDRYQMVLSVSKPAVNERAIERRFNAIQRTNRIPLKWYPWRVKEWYRKLTDLSEFMKRLNQSIARHIHEVGGHTGQVWRDRFKGEFLEQDADILSYMAFVELACVRSDLAQKPCTYKYCSAGRMHMQDHTAAGISLPRHAAFKFLGKGDQRYKAYSLFANRLGKGGHACKKAGALKHLFDEVSPRSFLRPGRKATHKIRIRPRA